MRKGKRKEMNREIRTSDQKPNKGKEQDHLKEENLDPLRQGQRLDTTEIKQAHHKGANTTKAKLKTHKSPPAHMHTPPQPVPALGTNQSVQFLKTVRLVPPNRSGQFSN
jgi:hypothetical protein